LAKCSSTSAAAAGQNIFGCTQPNAWAQFGILPTADSLTLGGITVPGTSGLLVSSGALSIAYGTAAHQALQGNTLGQPKGPASLDLNGNVPTSQLGNLGSAALLNASTFDGAGAAAAAVSAIPQSGPTVTKPALITPTVGCFHEQTTRIGFYCRKQRQEERKERVCGSRRQPAIPLGSTKWCPRGGALATCQGPTTTSFERVWLHVNAYLYDWREWNGRSM
jgi:hypothetical protein